MSDIDIEANEADTPSPAEELAGYWWADRRLQGLTVAEAREAIGHLRRRVEQRLERWHQAHPSQQPCDNNIPLQPTAAEVDRLRRVATLDLVERIGHWHELGAIGSYDLAGLLLCLPVPVASLEDAARLATPAEAGQP